MKRNYFRIFSIVTFGLMGLSYQNCSQLKMVPIEEEFLKLSLKSNSQLCFEGQLKDYTVDSFYISNLNYSIDNGTIVIDKDSDGISDLVEIEMGFNPHQARTNGFILDSICMDIYGSLDACKNVDLSCAREPVGYGLTDCDVKALGLDELSGVKRGLDSDKDGVLDYIEILKGTLVTENDVLSDLDHDFSINREELMRGTSPRKYENIIRPEYLIQSTISKLNDNNTTCDGEVWNLEIQQLPLVRTDKFINNSDFDHQKNENVILISIHLKPKIGEGFSQFLIYKFKLNEKQTDYIFETKDFSNFQNKDE